MYCVRCTAEAQGSATFNGWDMHGAPKYSVTQLVYYSRYEGAETTIRELTTYYTAKRLKVPTLVIQGLSFGPVGGS